MDLHAMIARKNEKTVNAPLTCPLNMGIEPKS
jgi:hypothetical protein